MPQGVTVRELLHLAPLAHARLVAGGAGLDRRVQRVNVMEVPDIIRWVEPGELLLTTAYPLRDDPQALVDLVPSLAEKGLAALALKPARYIEAIPDAMRDAAERLAFPLVELPPDSSFNDIMNAVLTVIINEHANRLQRTAAIHERFTQIVLGGGGLREIAEALSQSIAGPVAIVDAARVLQTTAGGADRLGRIGSVVAIPDLADRDGQPQSLFVQLAGASAIVRPIQVGAERFGAIIALERTADLPDDDADAIEYAATVAALRQVQARAVAEADRRFQAVCLEELVTGHMDGAALMERAVAFKWDLSLPRAVVLAQFDDLGGVPFARLAGRPEETVARHRLADGVRQASGRAAIVWERSAAVAALVPLPAGDAAAARELAGRIAAEAARAVPDGQLSVGVGTVAADPLDLSRSFTEARRALEIGRWSTGSGAVTVFEELGAERLLVGLPPATLRDFLAAQVGPLIAYDAAHRTDLVRTLETYLATRNAALAARQLFVHYNTLKNRLATIERVLGPFLDEPERCLDLSLALLIRQLPNA